MFRPGRAIMIVLVAAGSLSVLPPTSARFAANARAETAVPPSASGVSLRQCYEWAKERSERLKIRQEDVVQSEARARAALAGALPYVDWELNNTLQDPSGVDALERKGFSGFVEKNQVESKFAVNQTIFSGLRDFSARAGFKRERERNALLLERDGRELFEQVADAFYAVLEHQSAWDNAGTALELAQDRVKELRGFLRLGKARNSEVYTAQAHTSALQAQLKQIEARLVPAKAELSYLTGKDLSAAVLLDDVPNPPEVGALEDALVKVGNRSDVRAQREDVAAKKFRIRYEKGSYWPHADVTGSYYTQRATFLDEIDWDLVLSLKVPLYQGGAVASRVKEAESAYRQSVLTLEEMERRASYVVSALHAELSASVEEAAALDEAAQAAQKSYNALREEYNLGLVTNLEVLQALDLLQAERTSRDAAQLKAKRLFLELNAALEAMP